MVEFVMVPFITEPVGCAVRYMCQQVVTQNPDVDLCLQYQSSTGDSFSTFNPDNGNFSFMTSDKTTFPPGEYKLKISAIPATTFGGLPPLNPPFIEITIIMLAKTCDTKTVTATPQDPVQYEYKYGQQQLEFVLKPFVTDPPGCPLTYSCQLSMTDHTLDFDMCNFSA